MNDFNLDSLYRGYEGSDYYGFLSHCVRLLDPRYIVELGTGTGLSAKAMMKYLRPMSTLLTINWPNPPSGDNVGCELKDYASDFRLVQMLGDSRELRTAATKFCEMMFIDSGTEHTYSLVSEEWRVWESALTDRALVLLDDIDANDMRRFWDELQHEKLLVPLSGHLFGIVGYRR